MQLSTHKEATKKDEKALFLIHQCVDVNIFENRSESSSNDQDHHVIEGSSKGNANNNKG